MSISRYFITIFLPAVLPWAKHTPFTPRRMEAQGLHKDGCRTQGVCQYLEPAFCYLFSLAFFHVFLVGKKDTKTNT